MTTTDLPGIGVFGTDPSIRVLVPVFRQHGFQVTALWGATTDQASSVSRHLAISSSTSEVDDLLLRRDVGLVCIACPPNLHSQIAVKALGIGKHVLCLPPASLTQNEALKMVRAAQYYPSLTSAMCHPMRFLPAVRRMRRIISDGDVGELFLVEAMIHCPPLVDHSSYNWACESSMGGGVLNTLGSHIVDTITYITGCRVRRVNAMLRTYIPQTRHINGIRRISADDFATFQLELDCGAVATVIINSHLPLNTSTSSLSSPSLSSSSSLSKSAPLSSSTNQEFVEEIFVFGSKGYLKLRNGRLSRCVGDEGMREEGVESGEDSRSLTSPDLPLPYVHGLRHLVSALRSSFSSNTPHHNHNHHQQQHERITVNGNIDGGGGEDETVGEFATFDDALHNQAVLDALRESNGRRQWVHVQVSCEDTDPNPVVSAAAKHPVFRHATTGGSRPVALKRA